MQIAENPIQENYIGLPCMLGEAVGRIVGYDKNCTTLIDHNNNTLYSIVLFATPHGSVIQSGRFYINEITDEGMKQLMEYEEDAKIKNNGKLYDGRISVEKVEQLNKDYTNAQTH